MAKQTTNTDLLKSPELSKLKGDRLSISSVDSFCKKEMVGYGREVCSHRAIPSYIDGLKESTRKVLWCSKDQLKDPLKVFQLCGIVSFKMSYVHGDISLNKAITGMAQPHNSNMPMLKGIGQFGSYHFRSASAPRYISVVLSKLFNDVFMDNDICVPQWSDGQECEPAYMLPIIPYVLCNNTSGIAMGFASTIYARDVMDIIKECIRALKNIKKGVNTVPKVLTPSIPDFKGTCTPTADPNKWDVHGVYSVNKKGDLHIDEFIGEFGPFQKDLTELRDAKILTFTRNADKSYDVKFAKGNTLNPKLLTKLHLESTITENPTMTDENANIVEFNHVGEVIPKFVAFRSEFYKIRLKKLIDKTNTDIIMATNRIRFIKEHEDFYKKTDIEKRLDAAKYDRVNESYEYLLGMRVDSITAEKIKALEDKLKELKSKLKELKATDYIDMYISDLDSLSNIIKKM